MVNELKRQYDANMPPNVWFITWLQWTKAPSALPELSLDCFPKRIPCKIKKQSPFSFRALQYWQLCLSHGTLLSLPPTPSHYQIHLLIDKLGRWLKLEGYSPERSPHSGYNAAHVIHMAVGSDITLCFCLQQQSYGVTTKECAQSII